MVSAHSEEQLDKAALSDSSVAVLALSVLLTPSLALALAKLGVPSEASVSSSAGLAALINVARIRRLDRKKSPAQRVADLQSNRDENSPMLISVVVALVIVLMAFLGIVLMALLGGEALKASTDVNTVIEIDLNPSLVIVPEKGLLGVEWARPYHLALVLIGTLLVTRRAATRLATPLKWMIGSVFLAQFLAILTGAAAAFANGSRFDANGLPGALIQLPILVVPAAIGCLLAKPARETFVLKRLMRSLPEEDRAAVLDLLKRP